jgi:hypothetical protein
MHDHLGRTSGHSLANAVACTDVQDRVTLVVLS